MSGWRGPADRTLIRGTGTQATLDGAKPPARGRAVSPRPIRRRSLALRAAHRALTLDGAVLTLLRRLVVARATALLVVLTTSGLARAVPLAPVGPHRCTCSAHGKDHVCACRICNAAARRAREARISELPACHRAAARKDLAVADPGRLPFPCLLPTCGASLWEDGASPAGERFPLPAAPVLALAEWSTGVDPPAHAPRDLALVPETPPPRR